MLIKVKGNFMEEVKALLKEHVQTIHDILNKDILSIREKIIEHNNRLNVHDKELRMVREQLNEISVSQKTFYLELPKLLEFYQTQTLTAIDEKLSFCQSNRKTEVEKEYLKVPEGTNKTILKVLIYIIIGLLGALRIDNIFGK